MPKNLTDVSQWLTIAVPVGTDPATASSVETPFQLLTDRTQYLHENLMSAGLSNWDYVAHASFSNWGVSPLLEEPIDICYTSNYNAFTAIDSEARTIITKDPGLYQPAVYPVGGAGDGEWVEESDDPATCAGGGTGLGAGHSNTIIASSPTGVRVAIGDAAGAQGRAAESSVFGVWNGRTTADNKNWESLAYGNSVFIIGATDGTMNRSFNGQTWSTITGHGFTSNVRVIAHNGKVGSESKFMALAIDRAAYSNSDGSSWTGYSQSFGSGVLRLAYDAKSDTWAALFIDGSIHYSSNDGQTWTKLTDPLGLAGLTLTRPEVGLACDANSGWVVTYERYTGTHPTVATITSRRFAVIDNNFSNAIRTYAPRVYGCQRGGVCYGRDRFVTAGDAGSNFSLRLLG